MLLFAYIIPQCVTKIKLFQRLFISVEQLEKFRCFHLPALLV